MQKKIVISIPKNNKDKNYINDDKDKNYRFIIFTF